MRNQAKSGYAARWAAAVMALSIGLPAMAQTQSAYVKPHTSWGAPDLQGFWTNASITHMTRPPGITSLVITAEQAKQLEAGDFNNRRLAADQKPTDQSVGAPEVGKLPANGNYNAFWWDPGSKVAQINGEYRSSWIVEPADGHIPYKARPQRPALARASTPARSAAPKPAKTKPAASANNPKPFVEPGPSYAPVRVRDLDAAAKSYEGPEARSLGERCLIGFGGTGGPVLNNVLYNNMYQIVQSPGYALILTEMVHDARIIPITHDRTRPDVIKPWLGDSIGWYEGDTLVVETRNVNPEQKGYISARGKLTERFTRIDDHVILYQFEVDDPDLYTSVWRGEMPLTTGTGGLYEYACHEGNYGLRDILQGARHKEAIGEPLELTADSE